MSQDFAIRADGLGKCYRVGTGRRHDTLRDAFTDGMQRLFRRHPAGDDNRAFWALRDASFAIRHGESVGVIGLNGAGKSTLLKLLSRITTPTRGRAEITGRVSALLEVGTGFHWELTGRENIRLYAAILGMPPDEVRRNFDAIVDFADLAAFIDTPVKHYSSGMYMRLAFSVAAHLRPDILLLDEVLSVGDVAFQKKCMDFSKSLQRERATILFVSHNMFSIRTMCSRVIYIKQGQIDFDGGTDEGIKRYESDCRLATLRSRTETDGAPLRISDVALCGEFGGPKSVFDMGERMRIRVAFETSGPVAEPNFIVAFIRSDTIACCNYSSEADGFGTGTVDGAGRIELLTPPLKLVAGAYTVHVVVRKPGFDDVLCAQIGGVFHIRHDLFDAHFGVFHEGAVWRRTAAGSSSGTAPLPPGADRAVLPVGPERVL